jgi:hypothetical protein
MPRLSCPRECCQGTLEVDHQEGQYRCLSCARLWNLCPTPNCRGVLSQAGICPICHFGDDIVLYGAIRVTPDLFAEARVEPPGPRS